MYLRKIHTIRSRFSGSVGQHNYRSMSTTTTKIQLPRLPIPPLRDTLTNYLKSIEPLLLEDEARGGTKFSEAMEKRTRWSNEFEAGLGKLCQERLQVIDKNSPFNWLDDNFWLYKAYLEWRAPLLINSNWWLAYLDDPSISQSIPAEGELRSGISAKQIRRASWLLKRTLEFKERLESQELYPDTTRSGLWMRNTVPRMFNVCRIPKERVDELKYSDPTSPYHNKVLVLIHDWIYAIDIHHTDGKAIDHIKIEQCLRDIATDAAARLASGDVAPAVNVLSADERGIWAKNREYLLRLSKTNEKTMRAIEDGILIISLDSHTHITTDPTASDSESHLHNIRSGLNARNRWFDKGITLIVENNGRAGMTGEHSPVDALVPSIVADYSLAENIESDTSRADMVPLTQHRQGSVGRWERLDWVVDEHILDECRQAEERAKALITDSDTDAYWFTDYGADWIRNIAKLSPDAYLQMAMQLAWYQTRGEFTATYETALTRFFLHGRTETIRTLTSESREFVLTACNDKIPLATKAVALRNAINMHGTLTKAAMKGKGVDRHLLGLRLVMEDGEQSPLFDDWAFTRSQEWKLSTSGLSAGLYFRGTGFGTTYSDGYGINYLAGPDIIKFGIESKHSCKDTSTPLFGQALFDALRHMKEIITSTGNQDSTIPQSRL